MVSGITMVVSAVGTVVVGGAFNAVGKNNKRLDCASIERRMVIVTSSHALMMCWR